MMESQHIADALVEHGREAQEAQLTLSDVIRAMRVMGASEEACAELRFTLSGRNVAQVKA